MPFCQDILLTELRWATFSHEGHTINAYFGPQKKRDKGMDCLKSSSETSYRAALYSRHLFSEPAQDKKTILSPFSVYDSKSHRSKHVRLWKKHVFGEKQNWVGITFLSLLIM